ncbi:monooxygenase [Nibrella viscosa]|uniref:monooxygenase n=1 Tax=Nibrella viscosa TaxID=1084524 RepID=UPI0031E56E59
MTLIRISQKIGLWVFAASAFAQQPVTYQQHVRPIILKNCATPCHHPDGVGPFSLLSYQDVAKRAKFIAKVTQIRYMPPFPADRTFQHYANERSLSEQEIDLIQRWYAAGAPEGAAQGAGGRVQESKEKSQEIWEEGRKPDLVLKMSRAYDIKGDAREDFRYFHVPMNLKQDVYVEAIEFIPGNRKLLHHSRLMVDSTGTMAGIDGMAEDDPNLRRFQQTPLADAFLYGWVPGNDRVTFPAGTAKRIRAGSDLILNIHYAPAAKPETDQSEVRLYFARKPVQRMVQTLTLTENNISNQPFLLPANTRPEFFMSYGPLPEPVKLISVLPHMHMLGRTFKAFAITPDGEAINLIKIDNWDYKWQMTYQFSQLITVPKGSVILAQATYDNTAGNDLNPNRPPRDVGYGWNSTDEMMNLVLYYVNE